MTISCRGCGLPRTEDLFRDQKCPVCGIVGQILDNGEFESDEPWVIEEPGYAGSQTVSSTQTLNRPISVSGRPRWRKVSVGLLVVFAAIITIGVIWLKNHFTLTHGETVSEKLPYSTGELDSSGRELDEQVDVPISNEQAAREAVPPRKTLTVHIASNGTYAPIVAPGTELVVTGKVKRLIVSSLEGGAVLDCSALEATDVIVVGKIDGHSRLKLFAPSGNIRFLSGIGRNSHIDARAPGGTIVFDRNDLQDLRREVIAGNSELSLEAKQINIRIRIAGAIVKVKLNGGGRLEFLELSGSSQLEYAKAMPGDPDPLIERGKVAPTAIFFSAHAKH